MVCLTNHALDQFLEDMLPVMPELLRFGGCSKSDNPALRERIISRLQVTVSMLSVRVSSCVASLTKWRFQLPGQLRTRIKNLKTSLINAGKELHSLWHALQLEGPRTLHLITRCLSTEMTSKFVSEGQEQTAAAKLAAFDQWLDLRGEADPNTHPEMRQAAEVVEALPEEFVDSMCTKSLSVLAPLLRGDVWSMQSEERWDVIRVIGNALKDSLIDALKKGLVQLEEQYNGYIHSLLERGTWV